LQHEFSRRCFAAKIFYNHGLAKDTWNCRPSIVDSLWILEGFATRLFRTAMSNQQSSTANEGWFFACGYAALWDCFFLDSFSFQRGKYGEQN
jgi:hypothetical protein